MTNKNRLRIKPMRFFIDFKSKFANNVNTSHTSSK